MNHWQRCRCKEMRIDTSSVSTGGRGGMHDAGQAATKQASGWLQGSHVVADLASLRSTLSQDAQRLQLAGPCSLLIRIYITSPGIYRRNCCMCFRRSWSGVWPGSGGWGHPGRVPSTRRWRTRAREINPATATCSIGGCCWTLASTCWLTASCSLGSCTVYNRGGSCRAGMCFLRKHKSVVLPAIYCSVFVLLSNATRTPLSCRFPCCLT